MVAWRLVHQPRPLPSPRPRQRERRQYRNLVAGAGRSMACKAGRADPECQRLLARLPVPLVARAQARQRRHGAIGHDHGQTFGISAPQLEAGRVGGHQYSRVRVQDDGRRRQPERVSCSATAVGILGSKFNGEPSPLMMTNPVAGSSVGVHRADRVVQSVGHKGTGKQGA